MGVFDVVDGVGKEAPDRQDPLDCHQQGTQRPSPVDGADHGEHDAPTPRLDMVKAVLNHASASKGGFGRVMTSSWLWSTYAGPTSTPTPRPDNYDARTRARKCGKLKRCLYGTRQAARTWLWELEVGIKEADLKIGEMSKCTFRSLCGRLCVRAEEASQRVGDPESEGPVGQGGDSAGARPEAHGGGH